MEICSTLTLSLAVVPLYTIISPSFTTRYSGKAGTEPFGYDIDSVDGRPRLCLTSLELRIASSNVEPEKIFHGD